MNNLNDAFVYSGFLTLLFVDSCFILALIFGAVDSVKNYLKHRKNGSNIGGVVNE